MINHHRRDLRSRSSSSLRMMATTREIRIEATPVVRTTRSTRSTLPSTIGSFQTTLAWTASVASLSRHWRNGSSTQPKSTARTASFRSSSSSHIPNSFTNANCAMMMILCDAEQRRPLRFANRHMRWITSMTTTMTKRTINSPSSRMISPVHQMQSMICWSSAQRRNSAQMMAYCHPSFGLPGFRMYSQYTQRSIRNIGRVYKHEYSLRNHIILMNGRRLLVPVCSQITLR
mmetsp:Transcript_6004/g.16322  ORF Transcript_6004/g.16322 Transcript_6004/m.16322 type:complete len:231 (-) Transcript_6004:606-1298(-)